MIGIDMIQYLKQSLERKKGQKEIIQKQIKDQETKIKHLESEVSVLEESQKIIQYVAKETQDTLRYRISDPVSYAMAAVFDDPYTLDVQFPVRRGRTECDLLFSKDGVIHKDLCFSGGGGPVDVAAFGLQVSVLTLGKGRIRQLLILDEPLKWLKGGDYPERGAMMINDVAHKLGIQVIMVSHIAEQVKGADKIIEFVKRAGKSFLKK